MKKTIGGRLQPLDGRRVDKQPIQRLGDRLQTAHPTAGRSAPGERAIPRNSPDLHCQRFYLELYGFAIILIKKIKEEIKGIKSPLILGIEKDSKDYIDSPDLYCHLFILSFVDSL